MRQERNWKSRYWYLVFVFADYLYTCIILASIVHRGARIMGLTIEKSYLAGKLMWSILSNSKYRAHEVQKKINLG